MPILSSDYSPPSTLRGGHLGTIFPTLFRKVPKIDYERERLELSDGDFLDLDWVRKDSQRLTIIAHGLEGDSQAKYVRGMTLAMLKREWDTLSWNCRGCGGSPNRLIRSYHSGISEDLAAVVSHALAQGYSEIALVGFSLGGNITLKYLGEEGENIDPCVKAAVAFSVPCDLASSSRRLGEPTNAVYMRRFMDGLKEKVREKDRQFPGKIDLGGLDTMKTFAQFDERFTAPLNGFTGATDYWEKASSKPMLASIAIPTLLVNALNDPFLAPECFPYEIAKENEFLHLETPEKGGHVGFASRNGEYWSETRCGEFLVNYASSISAR